MNRILVIDQILDNLLYASMRGERLMLEAKQRGYELDYISLDAASEGDWVDQTQAAFGRNLGVVIRPSPAMRRSVALRDAIAAIGLPVIEVAFERGEHPEDILAAVCKGCISGFGEEGLSMAVDALCKSLEEGMA